jgi:hypothetical protein
MANIEGYSPNNFYYQNANICAKQPNNEYTHSAECGQNEEYSNRLHTSKTRYSQIMETYNQELLRTVNYAIGIGMLIGYIYVNQ